jgi:hypothetical protein
MWSGPDHSRHVAQGGTAGCFLVAWYQKRWQLAPEMDIGLHRCVYIRACCAAYALHASRSAIEVRLHHLQVSRRRRSRNMSMGRLRRAQWPGQADLRRFQSPMQL